MIHKDVLVLGPELVGTQLVLQGGCTRLASPSKPAWLEALLCEKFFAACCRHIVSRKNEKNIYCIDCSVGICQHCLSNHCAHRLLQIRRYVYHDVIRLQDIQKLLDCSHVQTYIINSARVVFLNQRPQPRPSKGAGNACDTCERSLQDAYRYCSIACKVDAVLSRGKDLQNRVPRCNSLQVSDLANCLPDDCLKACELESEEQLSPNSVLDVTLSPTSSGSTANDGSVWEHVSSSTVITTNKIRNENVKGAFVDISPGWSAIFPPSLNRRKGTPRRSPFC